MFTETGNRYVDSILWEIEEQSERFHNTQQWEEDDSIKAIEERAMNSADIINSLLESLRCISQGHPNPIAMAKHALIKAGEL